MLNLITKELDKDLSDIFYEVLQTRFTFIFAGTYATYLDTSKNLVCYTLICNETEDIHYNNFVNKLVKNKLIVDNLDAFIISLLHEIGHLYTRYSFNPKERKEYRKKSLALEKEGTKESLYKYFNLPVELAATKFASNFLNEHPDLHTYLRSRISSALSSFYLLNNLLTEEDKDELAQYLLKKGE